MVLGGTVYKGLTYSMALGGSPYRARRVNIQTLLRHGQARERPSRLGPDARHVMMAVRTPQVRHVAASSTSEFGLSVSMLLNPDGVETNVALQGSQSVEESS